METEKLRVLFIGTPGEYAMRPLQRVAESHLLVGIVESGARSVPAEPLSGTRLFSRRRMNDENSLWAFARRHRLPYLYLTSQNMVELRTFIPSVQPQIGCVASMNQLLPGDILEMLPYGFINFHPSLLPLYRGPAVWFWLYHDFAKKSGATIHYLDEGEDRGDILAQQSFQIETGMPAAELIEKTIELGANLMAQTLDDLAAGNGVATPQKHLPCPQRARYLRREEDLFDWQHWSLEHTYHFLCGAYPWYRAFKMPRFLPSCYDWRAVGFLACAISPTSVGKLRLDKQGFYFAHSQGKIRLRLRFETRWLIILLLFFLALANLLLNAIK